MIPNERVSLKKKKTPIDLLLYEWENDGKKKNLEVLFFFFSIMTSVINRRAFFFLLWICEDVIELV